MEKIGEGMSSSCYLSDDGTVLKKYNKQWVENNYRGVGTHLSKELDALEKLKGFAHFPQMINYCPEKAQIVMSYCGEKISKQTLPDDWREQCAAIESVLKNLELYHNDAFCKNICVLNGVINLIDFGLQAEKEYKNNDMVKAIEKEILLVDKVILKEEK